MFNSLKRAFGFEKKQQPSKYALAFSDEIFEGGMSKESPQRRLTKCFPFASLLIETINENHPDLAIQIKDKNISDQYEIISHAAGMDCLPKGGIENVSLYLLIHLEHGDLLRTIRDNFPDRYKRAVEGQAAEISPLIFTVRLLEEFGVENRTFPDCYVALKTQVSNAKPGIGAPTKSARPGFNL